MARRRKTQTLARKRKAHQKWHILSSFSSVRLVSLPNAVPRATETSGIRDRPEEHKKEEFDGLAK
jgi:hypothetical protein